MIQEGIVVGVAFQGISQLENAGFFIPPNIIKRFLKDIEDGTYDGIPQQTGLRLSSLHNPSFRKALGLKEDHHGARIDKILYPFPQTRKLLRENDVIFEIAGNPVGNDGTIFYGGNRVDCSVLFTDLQHGEKIHLKVWRDGSVLDIDLPLFDNREDRRIEGSQKEPPPYIIIGGLVFTELSHDYMNEYFSSAMRRTSQLNSLGNYRSDLLYQIYIRSEDETLAGTNPIVLSKILTHPINVDLGVETPSMLSEVNGQPIHSIQDLKVALEQEGDAFHRFHFASGEEEALNRAEAQVANDELLEQFDIPSLQKL